MPRYFFHCTAGIFGQDREGTELPDLVTARLEAVRFAAGIVKDRPECVWNETTFRVEVSDETGMLLTTVMVLGIDAPAARGVRGQSRPIFPPSTSRPSDPDGESRQLLWEQM